MKSFIASNWSNLALAIVLVVLLLAAILWLAYLTYLQHLTPGDTIQIIALLVLVIVTGWYALSTHRINRAAAEQAASSREQAKTSKDALQVALNAQKNALLPIIKMESRGLDVKSSETGTHDVSVDMKNIGNGPALYLSVWIENRLRHTEHVQRIDLHSLDILESGDSCRAANKFHLQTSSMGIYDSGFVVVAGYTDIFDRKVISRLDIAESGHVKCSFQPPEVLLN